MGLRNQCHFSTEKGNNRQGGNGVERAENPNDKEASGSSACRTVGFTGRAHRKERVWSIYGDL